MDSPMSVSKWEAELKRLESEKLQILEESTERRLENNRRATMAAMNALTDARRAESRQINSAPLPPEYEELRQSNMSLLSQIRGLEERATNGVGAFPEKYVRGDAVAHFRKQFAEAEAKQSTLQDQINRVERHPNATAGGRLRQELAEAEAITGEWPKVEKLCRFGEQIFALKQDIAANQQRQSELQNQRRESVLATA
jgi:hypothetical protein